MNLSLFKDASHDLSKILFDAVFRAKILNWTPCLLHNNLWNLSSQSQEIYNVLFK